MKYLKIAAVTLLIMFSVPAISANELPDIQYEQSFFIIEASSEVIDYWKDGKAYNSSDQLIVDGWGYDSEADEDVSAIKFDKDGKVIKRAMNASDIDSSKGTGTIQLKLNVENEYTTPILIILEGDNGAGIEFKFSADNRWEQIKKDVPAGNYRIYQIAEASIRHYPIDKEFVYFDTYTIEKDKVSEFEIGSVEYYDQEGLDRPSEEQINVNNNADVPDNHEEEAIEEVVKDRNIGIPIFIGLITVFGIITIGLIYIYRKNNR